MRRHKRHNSLPITANLPSTLYLVTRKLSLRENTHSVVLETNQSICTCIPLSKKLQYKKAKNRIFNLKIAPAPLRPVCTGD